MKHADWRAGAFLALTPLRRGFFFEAGADRSAECTDRAHNSSGALKNKLAYSFCHRPELGLGGDQGLNHGGCIPRGGKSIRKPAIHGLPGRFLLKVQEVPPIAGKRLDA